MKFSESITKVPQETDRPELKEGLRFTITGIVISTETRYDKIAKINGLDLATKKIPLKYRTTSKTIVKQCEGMLVAQNSSGGVLRDAVDVEVKKVFSGNKRNYLTFVDPV